MLFFDLDIIKEIKELKEEQIENYIKTRIEKLELENDSENNIIEPSIKEKTAKFKGFIPRNMEVIADTSAVVGGFLLNDNEIYRILIDKIRNTDNNLQAIQESINEYFGGLALSENETNRKKLYDRIELEYSEFEPYSISEYRNNNTALCTERTALAQNMISFLGGESYYIMGHLSSSNGIANMNHAYTCLINKEHGSGMLIDFTNPIVDKQTNQMHVYHSGIMSKDFLNKVLNGEEQIELNRSNISKESDKQISETISCCYSMNRLKSEQTQMLFQKGIKIDEISLKQKSTKDLVKESLDILENMKEFTELEQNINNIFENPNKDMQR